MAWASVRTGRRRSGAIMSPTCAQAGWVPSGHTAARAPVGRMAAFQTVVGDQKVAGVSGERLQWHAGGREQVRLDGNEAPWGDRRCQRAAREAGKDSLLL